MKTQVEVPLVIPKTDVAQAGLAASASTPVAAAVAEAATAGRVPSVPARPTRRAVPPVRWRWVMRVGRALVMPVAILLLWQLATDPRVKNSAFMRSFPGLVSRLPNAQILPPPTQVFTRWVEYAKPAGPYAEWHEKLSRDEQAGAWKGSWLRWLFSGELLGDAWSSLQRVLVGFVIGAGLALPLGLFMGTSDTVYHLFNPLLQVLRPIPPIAYIPLSILWFGLGNPPAYFLISLGAFFPVLVNTISGVRNVDGIFVRAARNLGAKGLTMFWRVILPAATPYILTGVRVGIGVAFIVVIVAEMIAVNSGLGYRILEAREFFWSDKIIAGMVSIGLLGLGLDTLMDRLNSHLLRWHRGADAAGGH